MQSPLFKDALRAAAWSYVGVGAYICLQFVGSVTIARLLGPDAVGLFTLALVINGPLRLLSDMGIGAALIQHSDLDDSLVYSAFSALFLSGLVCAVGLFLGATSLADIFSEPRLAAILRVISVTFLLYPTAIVCSSLLARRLNQRLAQLASISGYLIGYLGVGLTCAFFGAGPMSLALGFSAQIAVWTAILYAAARPSVRFVAPRRSSSLLHFGSRALLANLSSWAQLNADNLMVSNFFGATSLGYYSVVYNLMRTPLDHIVGTLQGVILPTASRTLHNRKQLASGYIAALEAVWVVTLPCFISIALIAPLMVAALYGGSWAPAGILLPPIAVAMPFQAISLVSSGVLWGTNGVGKELRVQLYATLLFLVLIYSLAHVSLVALAWGVPLLYGARATWLVHTSTAHLGIDFTRAGRALIAGTVLSPLVSTPLLVATQLIPGSPIQRLLTCIGLAAILWLAEFSLLIYRMTSPEFKTAMGMAWSLIRQRMD